MKKIFILFCVVFSYLSHAKNNSRVYLLTAGLGETIESRYGHTIVRVLNEEKGTDININWGFFSFYMSLTTTNSYIA